MKDFVTILGFGVTGQALARFCEYNKRAYKILEDAPSNMPSSPFCLGRGDPTFADLPSAVYLSPGLAPAHPWRQAAQKRNIPEWGEFALAATELSGKFIGVTGTNGKSTVVTLIHALLKNAGVQVGLFGNIGTPLIDAVSAPPLDVYVVEESSFQLETMGKLRHHGAICMNVTDDHYERYNNIEEYAAAKSLILTGMSADDFFIYNHDDPHCERMSRRTTARRLPFSLVHEFEEGAFMRGEALIFKMFGQEFIFDLRQAALKGLHNDENMMAALTAALVICHNESAIQSYAEVLQTFRGLPHRVEWVAERDGVKYYDDSKGTNVGAVVMALAGFSQAVILIAGGRDKGGDYTPLKGLLKGKVKHLILIGEARKVMSEVLAGSCPISECQDMQSAVRQARNIAKSGDVVLLSPACSSFDQYRNYHERGLDFQKWVRETT